MNRKRFLAGSAVVAGGAAVPVAVWGAERLREGAVET